MSWGMGWVRLRWWYRRFDQRHNVRATLADSAPLLYVAAILAACVIVAQLMIWLRR